MQNTIVFKAYNEFVKCEISFDSYANNNHPAINFYDIENNEPWDTVTVNLPGVQQYQVAVKQKHNYNTILIDAEYVKKVPIGIIKSGYNTYEIYELTEEAKKAYFKHLEENVNIY